MQKVFIADHSEDFSSILAGALRAKYQVETCTDGNKSLALIRASRPDVLIMDLMLPNTAGMDILKIVRDEALCSAVIITGRFFSDFLLECLQRYAVDYVTLKPCSIPSITDRVDELCAGIRQDPAQQPDPHCAVSSMLLALNVATHKKGFRYCRQGILILAEDPTRQVTKEVYPAIAKQYGTSKTAVEKAIRSAIDSAWESRSNELWRQFFPMTPGGQIAKPTNTQFLTRLADSVSIGQRAAERGR